MIQIKPIGIRTAQSLINYQGKSDVARLFAEKQLKGTVALYNILAKKGFAYLADEVGMGKTYTALGVVALLRHLHPHLRVLYIAPRPNIQKKWLKEYKNFVANNWRVIDHRVKTFHDKPAADIVPCENLTQFLYEVLINANRDFMLKLTSFSFPLDEDTLKWKEKRDELRRLIDWIPTDNFSLLPKDKAAFKDAYARAINAVLPRFDLLIIDEGHNLKHGFGKDVSSRNRLLGLFLGHEDDEAPKFKGFGNKVDRVLVLSATPLEGDYRELWNQMDILNKGKIANNLINPSLSHDEHKRIVGDFMLRRLTSLTIGGNPYTKNMYRREWRNGGIEIYDNPLILPDERKRLIVALIQKKVTEILAETGKRVGNHLCRSFQIGMLSSFESFYQTTKITRSESDKNVFDQTEQTQDPVERDGLDTPSINIISESYRKRFGISLPHPKMDSVAEEAFNLMIKGDKSLIFVRRIKSVHELTEKIAISYDNWIFNYILFRLSPNLSPVMRKLFDQYRDERNRITKNRIKSTDVEGDEEEDKGGSDTFFSWFFRGTGPDGFISGASFKKNRLDSDGSYYSTFFYYNYVTWLLGSGSDPINHIALLTGYSSSRIKQDLRQSAYRIFRRDHQQIKFPRKLVFLAYQEATLRYLSELNNDLGFKSRIVLQEAFPPELDLEFIVPHNFPESYNYLTVKTFFNELDQRPNLKNLIWPEPTEKDFIVTFRERELSREMIASTIRLGHPLIDLWILAIRNINAMQLSRQKRLERVSDSLIYDFLNLLEEQITVQGITSFGELYAVAKNFHLIVDVNFPDLREKELCEIQSYYGSTLGGQTPVGGMWGGVNPRMVKQFRMPGYPYVLVSTDVLQEGEDLHTFCSRIIHYGISWTPSAMEQRTGRIDRIGSLTQRRLDGSHNVNQDEFLQVYYPYLSDTVEVLQVQEIFKRMNRFLIMLHEVTHKMENYDSSLDATDKILSTKENAPIKDLLKSPFDVKPEWLPKPRLAKRRFNTDQKYYLKIFNHTHDELSNDLEIDWEDGYDQYSKLGTVYLKDDILLRKGESRDRSRKQPFVFYLHSAPFGNHILLRYKSPIGIVDKDHIYTIKKIINIQKELKNGKVCAIPDDHRKSYNLTAETDILFHTGTSYKEVITALTSVTKCADIIEKTVLYDDQELYKFREDLVKEIRDE